MAAASASKSVLFIAVSDSSAYERQSWGTRGTDKWEPHKGILTEQAPDTLIGLLAAPCDTTYDDQLLPVEHFVCHSIFTDA